MQYFFTFFFTYLFFIVHKQLFSLAAWQLPSHLSLTICDYRVLIIRIIISYGLSHPKLTCHPSLKNTSLPYLLPPFFLLPFFYTALYPLHFTPYSLYFPPFEFLNFSLFPPPYRKEKLSWIRRTVGTTWRMIPGGTGVLTHCSWNIHLRTESSVVSSDMVTGEEALFFLVYLVVCVYGVEVGTHHLGNNRLVPTSTHPLLA